MFSPCFSSPPLHKTIQEIKILREGGLVRDAVFLPSFRKRKCSLSSATFFKLNQKHTSNTGRANTSNTAFFLAAEKNDILDNSFPVPLTEDVWSRQDGRPANFVRGFRYSPLSRKFKIRGTYPAAKVCCRKSADQGSDPTPCKH